MLTCGYCCSQAAWRSSVAVACGVYPSLCQVAMRWNALSKMRLAVLERHPHSRDLYAETERFTPISIQGEPLSETILRERR